MYSDWHALGDTTVFYRKWLAYDLEWKNDDGKIIDLSNCHICGASLGGCIAVFNTLSLPTNNKFFIFTSSGILLAAVPWDGKKIAGLGWSEQEQLIVVLDDGNAVMYDIHGKLIHSFVLVDLVNKNIHVMECHFWGNGVVVIASDMQLYVAEGITSIESTNQRKYTMRTGLTPDKPYSSMAIIPPLHSRSGLLEVNSFFFFFFLYILESKNDMTI